MTICSPFNWEKFYAVSLLLEVLHTFIMAINFQSNKTINSMTGGARSDFLGDIFMSISTP